MTVYGNHYRVNEGGAKTTMATYDFGVASIFQQPQATHEGTTLSSIQYVGVLKDIILLDYGPVSQPMVFFKCEWVTHGSNRCGNPTNKRDEDGFLLANFCHLKANINEPYVFPMQVQQVFYAHDPSTPWWKIIFHKEPRSKRVVVENNEKINIHVNNVIDTKAPLQIPKAPSDTTLVGAIELTRANVILVVERLKRPSNDDEEEAWVEVPVLI